MSLPRDPSLKLYALKDLTSYYKAYGEDDPILQRIATNYQAKFITRQLSLNPLKQD